MGCWNRMGWIVFVVEDWPPPLNPFGGFGAVSVCMKKYLLQGLSLFCGLWMLACAARPVPPPVACKDNGDCVTPRTQCSGGVCLAISSAECVEQADCLRGSSCKNGTCQLNTTCQSDADCPAKRICSANQCAVTCSQDRDCDLGHWCRNTICRASKDILCAAHENCPPDADCDTASKTCSKIRADNQPETCTEDKMCRIAEELCHPAKKACIPKTTSSCQVDEECPVGFFCQSATLRCEPKSSKSCTQDNDCNAISGQKCDATTKVCIQPCSKPEDCTIVGQICATDSKICVPSCRSHADCPAVTVCDFKTHLCLTRK